MEVNFQIYHYWRSQCAMRGEKMKKVKIFAHRGASAYAPENTLEAFSLAMEQGADGIELDVQMTRDGELVVIHDETIDRVSGGKGFVKDFTLEELKKFSVSNGFEKYPEVRIPTLQEVLELVKPSAMEVNIELKTGIFWYPEIERKVLDLVRREGMEERVIYSSFNHYSIQKIRQLSPEAETAYLIGDVMLDVAAYTKNTGVKGLHPALFHVKMADFLKEYKESGVALRVWTVNDKEQIRWMIDEGMDAVITNYPDRGLEARAEAEAECAGC